MIQQAASGGPYTVTLPGTVLGGPYTTSTTPNAVDVVGFYYDGSVSYWAVENASGSGSLTINNNGNDRLLTANNTTSSIEAEAGLTWTPGGSGTGSHLYVNGSLGVGTSANTNPSINGLIRATNDIVAFFSSDERLKENKKIIENALEKVGSINGYEFDWIPKEGIHDNKGHDIGVIAQEIEKIIPEVVTTRESGYKAVKYEKIVPLLIQAIKEMSAEMKLMKEILYNK